MADHDGRLPDDLAGLLDLPGGVSGSQPAFEGSDRQGRGRLVDALRIGPVSHADLALVMGWPDDTPRAERCASRVVADGIACTTPTGFSLP